MVTILGATAPIPPDGLARGPRGHAGADSTAPGPTGATGPRGLQGLPGAESVPTHAAVKEHESTATALIPLIVPTYDRKPGVGHPDVLHVPGGWNGYAYWMAFTPLPGSARENPSVVASHDGITWEVPTGLTNPVVTYQQALDMGYDYWADTDIVLSHDKTTMLMYFKGTQTGVKNEYLLTTSTNGITWTAPTVVIPHAQGAAVSPSIITEPGGGYTMFEMKDSTIARRTSADGVTWSAATLSTSKPTIDEPWNSHLWHLDVCKVGGTYHALVNALTIDPNITPFALFRWWSTDGLNWVSDGPRPAVPRTGGLYDKRGFYRSTIQPAASGETGKFDVWTSSIDDTRASNHTAAVWRTAVYRNIELSSGDGDREWAFPEPPRQRAASPLEGDSIVIPFGGLVSVGGTATLTALNGQWPAWSMPVDAYLSGAFFIPHTWHQWAMDVMVANPLGTGGDASFTGYFTWGHDAEYGYNLSHAVGRQNTANFAMPSTQWGASPWQTIFDAGSDSAFDARHGTPLMFRLRRRGGPANTYGAGNPVPVLAVRFRRVWT